MKVAIAADHAGYDLKEKIKVFLKQEGHEVIDVGPESYEPGDDYPKYAAPAAEMVANGRAERGIVICDSGIGVDVVANKVPGIRSALVHYEELAVRTRQHNDTNVLALGSMFLDEGKAERIVKNWLDTEFSGEERHVRRIGEIGEIERVQAIMEREYLMDDDGE
jgi:ribose 5-phosphate isomerase B